MAEKRFEQAMKRLEKIVQSLESGELSLEDAIKVFEEGVKLAEFCTNKLEEAEKKVSLLVQEREGRHTKVPFEVEEKKDVE